MLKKSEFRLSPPDEVIGLLHNSRDLAMAQHLREARDVIRAAKIVAESFSLVDDDLFERLDDAVISKPYHALHGEYDNAFISLRRNWKKKSE